MLITFAELLAKRRMGSQVTKYKMRVQRKRKIEVVRGFLSQLCLDCDGHENAELLIGTIPFVTILEATKHFITRLIALLDNLNVINQRRLDRDMIIVTERALAEIQETAEMLIMINRYVLLGRSYRDFEDEELMPVHDTFMDQISDMKELFSIIVRYVEAAIHITRPNGQYLFKDELEPTLSDVLSCLLFIKEQLSNYHHNQTLTMEKVYEIMQQLHKRSMTKVFVVALVFFVISVYQLFSTMSVAWAVTLSIACGFTEWFLADHMIKTLPLKLMYDEFKLRESLIINTKYNGRLFCINR